ncbi:MAG TPA: hypothetical protein VMW83_06865 [Spirochaetia bacterium]|nr:hypothetical protein [Spirochaetia bacterium]
MFGERPDIDLMVEGFAAASFSYRHMLVQSENIVPPFPYLLRPAQ